MHDYEINGCGVAHGRGLVKAEVKKEWGWSEKEKEKDGGYYWTKSLAAQQGSSS